MKKTTKKLILSSMALGLAAATSVGSAFAWFTINSDVTVSGMSMTVKTENDLRVALEGVDTTWKSKLDLSSQFAPLADVSTDEKYASIVWNPATSVNGKDFYVLDDDLFDFGDITSKWVYNGTYYDVEADAKDAALTDYQTLPGNESADLNDSGFLDFFAAEAYEKTFMGRNAYNAASAAVEEFWTFDVDANGTIEDATEKFATLAAAKLALDAEYDTYTQPERDALYLTEIKHTPKVLAVPENKIDFTYWILVANAAAGVSLDNVLYFNEADVALEVGQEAEKVVSANKVPAYWVFGDTAYLTEDAAKEAALAALPSALREKYSNAASSSEDATARDAYYAAKISYIAEQSYIDSADHFVYTGATDIVPSGSTVGEKTAEISYVEFKVHFAAMGGVTVNLKSGPAYDVTDDSQSGSASAAEVLRISTQVVDYKTDPDGDYSDAKIHRLVEQEQDADLALAAFNDVYSNTKTANGSSASPDNPLLPLQIDNKSLGLAAAGASEFDSAFIADRFFACSDLFNNFEFTPNLDETPLVVGATPVNAGNGYQYTTVIFRVWFEGNDNSCMNSIFNQTVNASFVFSQKI